MPDPSLCAALIGGTRGNWLPEIVGDLDGVSSARGWAGSSEAAAASNVQGIK